MPELVLGVRKMYNFILENIVLVLTAPFWIPVSAAAVVLGKKLSEAQADFNDNLDRMLEDAAEIHS